MANASGNDLCGESVLRAAVGKISCVGQDLRAWTRTASEALPPHLLRALIEHLDALDGLHGEIDADVDALLRLHRRSSALQDDFLATISHELRTPLTPMLGWSDLMCRESMDDSTLRAAAAAIGRNARALARVVDDLLEAARLSGGDRTCEKSLQDPTRLVHAALECIRSGAEAKNISMSLQVDPFCPPILADPRRLGQALEHVLQNAVKFTGPGGRVCVTLLRAEGGVRIEVIDNGRGISAEFMPFVFDRFTQEEPTRSRTEGGLGLGLALANQLIHLHGGSIAAHSDGKGKGTTFTVLLPMAQAPHAAASALTQPNVQTQAQGTHANRAAMSSRALSMNPYLANL